MPDKVRVLAFSDLAWETRERGSPDGKRIGYDSFMRIVEEANPEVVVFVGDAAYDRCSRSGLDETELFLALLRSLISAGRYCIIVEGNNDDAFGTYNRVMEAAERSPYLHEVSGKVRVVCGIRFLGVPTGKERKIAGSTHEEVDVVVAHAPLADRVWLFDLPAACIITGHYSMMVTKVAGKAYVALDCSPASYAVVDWEEGWRQVTYVAGACRVEMCRGEGAVATGCGATELRRLTNGPGELPYWAEIEVLQREKREIAMAGLEAAFDRLLGMGIKKTHIKRYLGRQRMSNRRRQ